MSASTARLLRRTLKTAAALTPVSVLAYEIHTQKRHSPSYTLVNAESARASSLPLIPASRVRASDGKKNGKKILVTYGTGVYDITEFAELHPGGTQILQAAGGPLEPFWALHSQHETEEVREVLEELRVGNLQVDDLWLRDEAKRTFSSILYNDEPTRSGVLRMQSETPYNAETPGCELVKSHVTPNDVFYVRNHMPVPRIKADEYRLHIVNEDGNVVKVIDLNDIKTKYKRHEVVATVQCAGNRRNGLREVRAVRGGSWEIGAIGNARWTGARLQDVLSEILKDDNGDVKHVWFEGLDKDVTTDVCYEASIPIEVLRRSDVLLAYEMNGVELPRDHGFPVRVVVPGVAGARHVKWVGKIGVSKFESLSHWQREDYRVLSGDVEWKDADFSKAPSIQEMPVTSAICAHEIAEKADGKYVMVRGYAWSGDGRGIIRVDVSADGGDTWHIARTKHKTVEEQRHEVYDWTLWETEIKIEKNMKDLELVCRAVDSGYNSQPHSAKTVWNVRGLLNNSWHRVSISVE